MAEKFYSVSDGIPACETVYCSAGVIRAREHEQLREIHVDFRVRAPKRIAADSAPAKRTATPQHGEDTAFLVLDTDEPWQEMAHWMNKTAFLYVGQETVYTITIRRRLSNRGYLALFETTPSTFP